MQVTACFVSVTVAGRCISKLLVKLWKKKKSIGFVFPLPAIGCCRGRKRAKTIRPIAPTAHLTLISNTTDGNLSASACCSRVSVCNHSNFRMFVCPAGALLFDHAQGFWLSHSIPHFPSFPEKGYLYPSSGKVNGQTALCVTYQYQQFLHIGELSWSTELGIQSSDLLHLIFCLIESRAGPVKLDRFWEFIAQTGPQLQRIKFSLIQRKCSFFSEPTEKNLHICKKNF